MMVGVSEELTLGEAAERFGVKRDTLERAAKEGRLKARKIGPKTQHPYVAATEDVAAFIRTMRRSPSPKAAE